MENKRSEKLLRDYLSGQCSPEEQAIVETWYCEISAEQKDELSATDDLSIKEEVFNAIRKERKTVFIGIRKLWTGIASAVAVVCILGFAALYHSRNGEYKIKKDFLAQNIIPGGNKATLTLANGKKISLTDSDEGQLAEQAGIRVTKTAEGQLIYTVTNVGPAEAGAEPLYNVIETPTGGKYEVNLPDGTRVWLNSASSLRYPLRFSNQERKVEMTGECYFEVAQHKSKPFRVSFSNQTVEVLGTHFNINAYSDEPAVKTTLLEGSVRLNYKGMARVLKPGQQAAVNGNDLTLSNVDLEQVVAWKKGDFAFDGTPLKAILRQISRWYNVEVSFEGTVADAQFGGSISRTKNINEVLKVLELTKGVHFKIEGRRILVMP